MSEMFVEFEVNHIPREENVRADLLARLLRTKGYNLNKMVIQETLDAPSTWPEEVMTLNQAKG